MDNLTVSERERKSMLENRYSGNICCDVLLSENEDIIYKCMCFVVESGGNITWHRLLLTNKKIIRLRKNEVAYTYLNFVRNVSLECVNETNKDEYEYTIRKCVEEGNTPYFLTINGDKFLLNNHDDAMTLLDEINRVICE